MYKLTRFLILGILSVLIFAADTHSQSNKTSLYLFESNAVDSCAGQMPGDANSDGSVNVLDIFFLNRFLRAGGPAPNPLSNGDFNGDCIIDTVDLNALVSRVLSNGPGPVDCTCLEPAVVFVCCVGRRGDINGDGDDLNILDLTFIVDFIFRGSGDPGDCPEEADLNGDGTPSNILDLTFLVDFIFRSGPATGPCEVLRSNGQHDPLYDVEITVTYVNGKTVLSLAVPIDLKGIRIDLVGDGSGAAISHLNEGVELFVHQSGNNLRVGLVDLQGLETIRSGNQILVELDGRYVITDVLASDINHRGVIPLINPNGNILTLPEKYELHQNYPNPFNPTTEISFGLSVASHVRLDILNLLGQKVTTLVDQYFEAGTHTVVWDGNSVASGVYFYRFEAGAFVETKKMVLLK